MRMTFLQTPYLLSGQSVIPITSTYSWPSCEMKMWTSVCMEACGHPWVPLPLIQAPPTLWHMRRPPLQLPRPCYPQHSKEVFRWLPATLCVPVKSIASAPLCGQRYWRWTRPSSSTPSSPHMHAKFPARSRLRLNVCVTCVMVMARQSELERQAKRKFCGEKLVNGVWRRREVEKGGV